MINRVLNLFRSRYSNHLRPLVIRLFSITHFARLCYGMFSNAFSGEHSKVLRGISNFIKNDHKYANAYSLRRNIHRIEKGLVMRPRRECFAADYILHTVNCYQTVCFDCDSDKALSYWAHDVLESYFSFANGASSIDLARDIFLRCPSVAEQKIKSIPKPRSSAPKLAVHYQDILSLAQRRRSVRWYLPTHVDRKLIDDAIHIAAYSPSACNRQPFEFRVFDDLELVRKVMEIPGGTSGWSHSPPVVVVLVGHLNAFVDERDRHLIYIDSSLAAMSFMYAVEALGLSSCAINFPDIADKNEAMAKLLDLSPHGVVTMVISVGYADEQGLIPFSAKKDLAQLRTYNKISA